MAIPAIANTDEDFMIEMFVFDSLIFKFRFSVIFDGGSVLLTKMILSNRLFSYPTKNPGSRDAFLYVVEICKFFNMRNRKNSYNAAQLNPPLNKHEYRYIPGP